MSDPNRRPRGNPNMRPGAPSVNPSGKARLDAAEAEYRARVDALSARWDTWQNLVTGAGVVGVDKRAAQGFAYSPISPTQGREMWLGDDIAARIVEELPSEALRQGWEIKVGDDAPPPPPKPPGAAGAPPAIGQATEKNKLADQEDKPPLQDRARRADAFEGENTSQPATEADAPKEEPKRVGPNGEELPGNDPKEIQEWLTERLKKLGVKKKLWDAGCHERATGGSALLLGAQDGSTDLRQPLNLETVRSFDWLTLVEAEEITPAAWYTNPMAEKYGEVEVWRLNTSSPGNPGPTSEKSRITTSVEVHETRLIHFPGIKVSRRVQNQQNGHGDNVFTRVWQVLQDFNGAYGSAGTLVHDFAQAVWGIKGLAELVAMDKNDIFKKRVSGMEHARSTLRATVIDAEGETFERKATPVTGLPELLDRFERRLAAATGMPLTRLMGMSPGGLNATGESDQAFFYDKVKTYQEERLQPALERIIEILLRVAGAKVDSWSIEWNALWQPTEKEKAEVRKIYMEIDTGYIGLGVYTEQECAVNRFGGDTWSSEMRLDFSARAMAEREEALQTAKAQELEVMKTNAAAKGGPPGAGGEEPDMVEQAGIPRGDAFDPDQERDENGRWTAGGAAAGRAKTSEEKAARTAKNREKASKEGERILAARVRDFKRNTINRTFKAPSIPSPEEEKEIEERGRELNKELSLDVAKHEFEYLERQGAELDALFDEIETRGISGPAVKALNAYRGKAGEAGKQLSNVVRPVTEKFVAHEKAARDIRHAFEFLIVSHEDDESDEDLLDSIGGLEELVSDISVGGGDGVGTLAELASTSRALSHVGNHTSPRDGELERVYEGVHDDLTGAGEEDRQDPPDRPFEERWASFRASVDSLVGNLDTVIEESTALEKTVRNQSKSLEKTYDKAHEEIDEIAEYDENQRKLGDDSPLTYNELRNKGLEAEREARGITMAGLDEIQPKDVTKDLKSARRAIAKLQKAIAKIEASRTTSTRTEPSAKYRGEGRGKTVGQMLEERLAARKAAEE